MAVAPTNQKALLRLSPTYCLIETVLIGKKRKKKKRSQNPPFALSLLPAVLL